MSGAYGDESGTPLPDSWARDQQTQTLTSPQRVGTQRQQP
jgi:hypothetical protein